MSSIMALRAANMRAVHSSPGAASFLIQSGSQGLFAERFAQMDPKTLAALITAIAALVAPLPSLLAVENGPPNNGKGASALERVRVIISVKVPPASALAIASCWRMRVV